jgi:hypothetical protein
MGMKLELILALDVSFPTHFTSFDLDNHRQDGDTSPFTALDDTFTLRAEITTLNS